MEQNSDKENIKTNPQSLQVWEKDKIEFTQTKYIERLSMRKMLKYIASSFNFEKGVLMTMKGLTIHPAKTIKSYLDTGRYVVTSPIKYFFLIVGLTIFIGSITGYYLVDTSQYLEIINETTTNLPSEIGVTESSDEAITKTSQDKKAKTLAQGHLLIMSLVNDLVVKYSNIMGLFSIIIISFISFLFFRSSRFNLTEHIAINTYLYVHASIVFLILIIIGSQNIALTFIQTILQFIMSLVVYYKLFQQDKVTVLFKTMGIFILGSIGQMIITTIITLIYLAQSEIVNQILSEANK